MLKLWELGWHLEVAACLVLGLWHVYSPGQTKTTKISTDFYWVQDGYSSLENPQKT
jgi:hypothetical protein